MEIHTQVLIPSSTQDRQLTILKIHDLLTDGLAFLTPVDRAIILATFGMTKIRAVKKQIREQFGLSSAEVDLRLELALSNLIRSCDQMSRNS
jgi:hypothetical protein